LICRSTLACRSAFDTRSVLCNLIDQRAPLQLGLVH
jgi:hypothetical protein